MKYVIALLLVANLCFAQEWSKTELNDFSSLEFPVAPDKTIENGDIFYSASDDHAIYLVMVRNIENQKIPESQLQEYYRGFMTGALQSANGTLIKQNEFTTNGINGYEMVYFADSNPQIPNTRHNRVFVKNNTLISQEFWTFEESVQLATKNKEKFFNSISVSTNNEVTDASVTDANKTTSATKIGFIVGQLIFFLFVLGLIVGVILIIRKLVKKKTN